MSALTDPLTMPPADFAKFVDEGDPLKNLPQSTSTTWYGRMWSRCTNAIPTCKKVASIAVSSGVFLGSCILRGVKYTSFQALPMGTTFSSLGIGIGAQTLLSNVLPEKVMKAITQLSMDNAHVFWFTVTSLDLLFKKEAFLTALAAQVGYNTALAISAYFQLKMTDMPWNHVNLLTRSHAPTIASEEGIEEEEEPPKCSLFGEPTNPLRYVLSHGFLRLAAGGIIWIFGNDPYATPVGIYLICDGIGISLGEAFQSCKSLEVKNDFLRKVGTVGFVFLEGGWGIIVTNFPHSPYAFAFMGIATGVTKPIYKRRFERVPPDLNNNRLPGVAKINLAVKIVFGTAFVGWLIKNSLDATDLGEHVALIICGATLPIAIIVKECVNRRFKWGQNHPIFNSIKFYMEDYTVPSAVIFTFIELFNGMGSTVLKKGDLVKSFIVPGCGWTVYMVALGGSMATINPRMPLALGGMSNTYMGWLMQGKG